MTWSRPAGIGFPQRHHIIISSISRMIVITINIVIELIEPTIVKPCLVLIHSIMILISIKMIMMIIVITRKKEIVLSLPCVTKERVMQRLSILGFFAQDIMKMTRCTTR